MYERICYEHGNVKTGKSCSKFIKHVTVSGARTSLAEEE